MQYDKQLTLSTGGSRHTTRWTTQTLWWAEFIQRLQTPVRSPEVLQAYLRLPKREQDDLKDVGGFVGGTLKGGIRRAGSVIDRCLVTLDCDAIQPGGTDDILRRADAMGCAYAIYSTRKHEPVRPRLRLIVPLNRPVTSDEYEPIARRLAEHIGLDTMDPTTFQDYRLMYWPSCCADSQYVFTYGDKPFADADGLLATYANWRDTLSWPQVPGAQKIAQKQLGQQEDPTTKPGIVGAFCRSYDVLQAMDKFLPGVYQECENAANRYTFTGGSTTGGAMVYGDGLFLYSHHATDPCSGRLVNAWDLVRLHRFADLDDEAKDGTPTVKLPSFLAMRTLAQADPAVAAILTAERGQRILDDFGEGLDDGVKGNVDLKTFLGSIQDETMTTNMVRGLLSALGITIRLNEITNAIDLSGYPESWSRENANNNLPTRILDALQPAGAKAVTKGNVCDKLDLIADENRFNPVLDMMRSTPWDGQDRVQDILSIWGVADPFEQLLVRKWLLQCAAMACNDAAKPYGADGVLTLQGPQGIGKTSACRELSPFPDLFMEGAQIDPRNKDTIIQATSVWLCELGELERTTKRDHESLRAIITASQDTYRTPYARAATKRPRRASFCGTVNPDEFLVDEAGNRRFWVIHIRQVDLARLFSLTHEWKLQLWAQQYVQHTQNPRAFRLTRDEQRELEQRNAAYTKPLDFEMEIRELLDYTLPVERWRRCRAGEIASLIHPRPPLNRLGRALQKIAREDDRVEITLNRSKSASICGRIWQCLTVNRLRGCAGFCGNGATPRTMSGARSWSTRSTEP